ncbi:MAG: cation:proton antiporter [Ruminococcus sp.]|uniref:cation:proton antiporter n=2 Tax=Ruminococcus sp. TaxID=41978 RepID=UPI003995505F
MGLKDFLFNNDYSFLLQIAIILLSTKLLGLLTKRISLPQVVGALAAGIVLGPMVLNVVQRNDLIVSLAELGVIVLMFSAGLETDIQELKKAGLASFVIALLGVIVPLVGGFFLADFYNTEQNPEMAKLFWQNIFIGVVLTATSVSITVETLKELGALNSRAGNAILGAAVIDDILGIIALTVVISLGGKKSGDGEAEKTFGSLLAGDGVLAVVINILAFFIVAIGAAVLYHFFFKKWRESSNENLRRHNIVTFVFCLLLSFVAEICFGVADITGAFVAGLAVSGLKKNEYVVNRFNTLSYMLLSPIFFANIGLAMTLKGLTKKLVVFMLLLMLLAVVTKVIGCGLGAKIMRYTNKESLQIGIGMISRGEVALIVANKGASVGLMSEKFMTPLVIMVVFTTIVTPILLKLVFPKKKGGDKETVSDDLTALEKSGINTGLEES